MVLLHEYEKSFQYWVFVPAITSVTQELTLLQVSGRNTDENRVTIATQAMQLTAKCKAWPTARPCLNLNLSWQHTKPIEKIGKKRPNIDPIKKDH